LMASFLMYFKAFRINPSSSAMTPMARYNSALSCSVVITFSPFSPQKYDIFLIQANNPLIFTPNRNSKTYRPLNTKSAFGTISLITGESFGSSIFVRSNSAASNNLFIQRGLKDILKDTLKDTLNDTLNDIAESILGLSNIHVFVLFFPQILLFSICQHALSLLFHLFSTVPQAVLLSHKDNL